MEKIVFFTAAGWLFIALLSLAGATIYDVQAVRCQRRQLAHPAARRYRRRPLISLLVITHNDQAAVERLLTTVGSGNYRKWELIIVDCNSSDNTRSMMRRYQLDHPRRPVRLVASRSSAPSSRALKTLCRRYVRGELILVMPPDRQPDKLTFAKLAEYANARPAAGVFSFNTTMIDSWTMAGLVQRYRRLLGSWPRKSHSLLGLPAAVDEQPFAYRKALFQELLPAAGRQPAPLDRTLARAAIDRHGAVNYVHDAYMQHSASGWRRLLGDIWQRQQARWSELSFYRQQALIADWRQSLLIGLSVLASLGSGLASLFLPVVLSYFLYLTVWLHQPLFLFLSGLALGLVLFLTIWESEQLTFRQKIVHSFGAPLSYVWLYLLSFISAGAMCLGLLARAAFKNAPARH